MNFNFTLLYFTYKTWESGELLHLIALLTDYVPTHTRALLGRKKGSRHTTDETSYCISISYFQCCGTPGKITSRLQARHGSCEPTFSDHGRFNGVKPKSEEILLTGIPEDVLMNCQSKRTIIYLP